MSGDSRGRRLIQQCNHFTAAQMNRPLPKLNVLDCLKISFVRKALCRWAFSIYMALFYNIKSTPCQYTAFEEIYIVYLEKQHQARNRRIEMTCASALLPLSDIHFFLNISPVFVHFKSDQKTDSALQIFKFYTSCQL